MGLSETKVVKTKNEIRLVAQAYQIEMEPIRIQRHWHLPELSSVELPEPQLMSWHTHSHQDAAAPSGRYEG